jgi:hypothetical protein
VSLQIGRRLGSLPHEQQLRTLHHRADASLVLKSVLFWFRFRYVFKLEHLIIYVFLL